MMMNMPLVHVLVARLIAMDNPSRVEHGRLGSRCPSNRQAETCLKAEYSKQQLLDLKVLFMGPISSCLYCFKRQHRCCHGVLGLPLCPTGTTRVAGESLLGSRPLPAACFLEACQEHSCDCHLLMRTQEATLLQGHSP